MKALVIGGGPAGASAAMGLIQSGFAVHLVEQRPVWAGRVCGSFLSPEARLQLEKMNLHSILKDAAVVKGTRVTTPSGFEATIPTLQNGRTGLTLPRQVFETKLLDAAGERGVEIRTGVRLLGFQKAPQGWYVELQGANTRETAHTDLLVLADGRFSLGNLKSKESSKGWYGFNCLFENIDHQPGEQSLHFFPGGYIGVVNYTDGTTNVCGLLYRNRSEKILWGDTVTAVRQVSPPLDRAMHGLRRASEWRGTGPLPFGIYVNDVGPVRVGDAAAVGDPFMGEGIGRALAAGAMLKAALDQLQPQERRERQLAIEHAAIWRKAYQKRWRFNAALRTLLAHKFSFRTLEVLLRCGPLLSKAAHLFHTGYDVDTAHEQA